MSVIGAVNPDLRRGVVSAADFRSTSRSGQRRDGWGSGREAVRRAGLVVLVVSALATLSALLGMTFTDNTAADTSTPLLASAVISAFAPTYDAVVQDEAANPLASTGGGGDAARTDTTAAALGSMGVMPPPRLDDRSRSGTPTTNVSRVIAEAFAAGAGSTGSGVHNGSVSSGGSGGLAILPALGTLPDQRLPRQVCTDYSCRATWIFSRPLVRPG